MTAVLLLWALLLLAALVTALHGRRRRRRDPGDHRHRQDPAYRLLRSHHDDAFARSGSSWH